MSTAYIPHSLITSCYCGWLEVFISFLYFALLVNAVDIYDQCQSTKDCTAKHSICRPLAPTLCPKFGQFCECQPGYREVDGLCKKEARLGDACDDSSVCLGESVICKWVDDYQGTYCECETLAEPEDSDSPKACIIRYVSSNKTFNGTCRSNEDCLRHQQCFNGRCTCPHGYRYAFGKDACLPITYGDLCTRDEDCINLGTNADCDLSDNTCRCEVAYTPISVTFKKTVRTVCHMKYAVEDYAIRETGQPCNEDPANGQLTFCTVPAFCTACTPDGAKGFCMTNEMLKANWTTPRLTETTTTQSSLSFETETTETLTSTTLVPAIRTKATLRPLGSPCTSDNNCLVVNSRCDNKTKSCQCEKGYVTRGQFQCRKPENNLFLGRICDPRFDKCGVVGSNCVNGTCQCKRGYKPGPDDNDCIEQKRIATWGDPCVDSNQCYYELVCMNSICTCFTGYKESGVYHCKKKVLGDQCPSGEDAECRFVKNAVCERGSCKCSFGYRRTNNTYCEMIPESEKLYKLMAVRARCEDDSDCWYPPAPAYSYCPTAIQFCLCDTTVRYYDAQRNRCMLYPFVYVPQKCNSVKDCDDARYSVCVDGTCAAPKFVALSSSATMPLMKNRLLIIMITLIIMSTIF